MPPDNKLKIKICGITRLSDAKMAVRLGADFLGFIFYPRSQRYISPSAAGKLIAKLPPGIKKVGVFVNENPQKVRSIAEKYGLDILQFHGEESKAYCGSFSGYQIIKAFRIKDAESLNGIGRYKADWILLDTCCAGKFGGTGKTFNWDLLKKLKRTNMRIILSGGLNPQNIKTAIKKVRPDAVDISSGIELSPGRKSPKLMQELFKAING